MGCIWYTKRLKKTGGNSDGDALIEAMKGMAWESPRGPISIDPQTRDIVSNIYIRKVEKINGHLYNTEFATFAGRKRSSQGFVKVSDDLIVHTATLERCNN